MATEKWHRSEPREVRPFFNARNAELALKETGIRLYQGSDVIVDDRAQELEEVEFKSLMPSVEIGLADPLSWMPQNMDVNDFEVVILVRQPLLKQSSVVFRSNNQLKFPKSVKLDSLHAFELGVGRNLQITIALTLKADRQSKPGSPFTAGHWISRKTFVIKLKTMSSMFDIRPRTEAEWIANNYPGSTFYLVDYNGGISEDLGEGGSIATVYIHDNAYNRMVSGAFGDSIQYILGPEMIASVLIESHNEWKDKLEPDEGSSLAKILKRLDGGKMTIGQLSQIVQKPGLLKAKLQDQLGVVAGIR